MGWVPSAKLKKYKNDLSELGTQPLHQRESTNIVESESKVKLPKRPCYKIMTTWLFKKTTIGSRAAACEQGELFDLQTEVNTIAGVFFRTSFPNFILGSVPGLCTF